MTARFTCVPAAPHAVHSAPLGSYACHTILHTAFPPKVLAAFTTPSTSSSCSYIHHVDGTPAAAACAAQALLSLPQKARASTCRNRPPCAPSRATRPATPATRTCNSKCTHTTPCCNTIPIYVTYPAMLRRCLCARRVSLEITPLLSFRPCRSDPPAPAGNHCMTHAPFASHFKLPYHHTTTTAAAAGPPPPPLVPALPQPPPPAQASASGHGMKSRA